MIEEAAVFIVSDEESGLRPRNGVGCESTDDSGQGVLAEEGRRWGMIGGDDGADDPGDLREVSRDCVCNEVGWELPAKRVFIELGGGILKVLEIGKDIVGFEGAEGAFVWG